MEPHPPAIPYITEWYSFQNHWLYMHRAQRITLLSSVQKHTGSFTMHYFNAALHQACVQHIQWVLLNSFLYADLESAALTQPCLTLIRKYKTDLRFISKHLLTAQNELQQRQETMPPTSPLTAAIAEACRFVSHIESCDQRNHQWLHRFFMFLFFFYIRPLF